MNDIQLSRHDLNLLVTFEALMTEGSVTKAAERLNKTPSAVSHALARLREQVGDPLMVKVGGRMQASPFALQLIDDIRPLLSGIKRVLQLPAPFDPASSARTFRIECPVSAKTLSNVANRVLKEAPHINIDWLAAPHKLYTAVAEGHIDLANIGGDRVLPDGVDEAEMPPMRFMSFVRKGHPAIKQWGSEAWNSCGHIKVAITNAARSPVDEASSEPKASRRIAARISEFSAVGPLLASTDLIATLPPEIMAWDMETYGLVPLPAIDPIPPFRVRFFWASRTANDPAMVWVRNLVMDAYRDAHAEATALVAARLEQEATL